MNNYQTPPNHIRKSLLWMWMETAAVITVNILTPWVRCESDADWLEWWLWRSHLWYNSHPGYECSGSRLNVGKIQQSQLWIFLHCGRNRRCKQCWLTAWKAAKITPVMNSHTRCENASAWPKNTRLHHTCGLNNIPGVNTLPVPTH